MFDKEVIVMKDRSFDWKINLRNSEERCLVKKEWPRGSSQQEEEKKKDWLKLNFPPTQLVLQNSSVTSNNQNEEKNSISFQSIDLELFGKTSYDTRTIQTIIDFKFLKSEEKKRKKNDKEKLLKTLEKIAMELDILKEDIPSSEFFQNIFSIVLFKKLIRKRVPYILIPNASTRRRKPDDKEKNSILKKYFIERFFIGVIQEKRKEELDFLNKYLKKENDPRRVEEKHKLVFKMVIKKLKEGFFQNAEEENKTEKGFWEFYFGSYCKDNAIPLEEIVDPTNKNKNKIKNTRFTGLNKTYLKLTFKNERFKKVFYTYLNTSLEEDYKRKIKKKFETFLKKFKNQSIKLSKVSDQSRVNTIWENIEVKRKYIKLPWFISNVRSAISDFKRIVSKALLATE